MIKNANGSQLLEDAKQIILDNSGVYPWGTQETISKLVQPVVNRLNLTSTTIKRASADYYLDKSDIIQIKGFYDFFDGRELESSLFIINRKDKTTARLSLKGMQMSFSELLKLGLLGDFEGPALPGDWQGKPNGQLLFDSESGEFAYSQQDDASGFSIPVLSDITFKDAGFGCLFNNNDGTSTLELNATTILADNEFSCLVNLPLSRGENLSFSLVNNSLALTPLDAVLSTITKLTGIDQLYDQLPAILREPLKAISLDELSIITGDNSSFRCQLSLAKPLGLFPGFQISAGAVNWEMHKSEDSYSVQLQLTGQLIIGRSILEVYGYISNDPDDIWNMGMSGEFTLPTLSDVLQLLPGVKENALALSPHWLDIKEIAVSRFDFSFSPGGGYIEQIDIEFMADAWIEPVKGLKFGQPEINFIAAHTEDGYELGGMLRAEMMVGETSFYGVATKDADGWSFNAGTGLTTPVPVNQLLKDVAAIAGAGVDASALQGIQVSNTYLLFELGRKEFTFNSEIDARKPIPFLNSQDLAASFRIKIHTKQQDEKTIADYNFLAQIALGGHIIAVEIDRQPEGERSFTGGWKAVTAHETISLEHILDMLGIQADLTALPALLNPEFKELALSYNEAEAAFALAAYTTNNTDYYLVAKKSIDNKWQYVLGLDYDAAKSPALPEVAELSMAAEAAGITQLHLLYAGTDLKDFKLPHVPQIEGKTSQPLEADKLINVKKGLFMAAEAKDISLPQIGKLRAKLKQFYFSIEKQEQVVVLLKGNMDFTADGQTINIALQANHASAKKDFSFKGVLTATSGVQPLLKALLDDQLQLPDNIRWPDINEATVEFDTATTDVSLSIKTMPYSNELAVDGLFKIGADQVVVAFSKTKADFDITGGHLQLDALNDVAPNGIGGSLTLHLEAENNRFMFTPSGFELVTPKIPYQECTEAKQYDGRLETKTVTRNLCARLKPGVLSFDQKDKQWIISAEADLTFEDFPDPVRRLFTEEKDGQLVNKTLKLIAGYKDSQLYFSVRGNLLQLEIPDLMAEIGGTGLPAFGKSAVQLSAAEFHIGKEINLSLELGYALPECLNEVLGLGNMKLFKTLASPQGEQYTRFEVSIGTAGLAGKVIESPFYKLNGITEEGDKIHVDLDLLMSDKDLGLITFIKPVIALDLEKGSFKFKGGYEIDPLRPVSIPLFLLKRFFEALKLPSLAQELPKSIPVKSMKLDDTLNWMISRIEQSTVKLPDALYNMLLTVREIEHRFPARFRGYLGISVPQSLNASIDVTADGGVSFSLTTTGDPLQFLLPTPMAFVGLRISHIALGTALGGSLLKFECSADMDIFDYAELFLSATVYDLPGVAEKLPPRDELQKTFSIQELLILIVYESGIPIPIPLFYQNLALIFRGIEGLQIHTAVSFPQPTLNAMKALKMINDLKDLFTKGKDLEVAYPLTIKKDPEPAEGLNLVFDAGPLYLRLPKYIAAGDDGKGLLLGWPDRWRLLDLLNLTGILLNGINHLIKDKTPAYMVQALPLDLRYADIKITPLQNLDAAVSWLLATPGEVKKLYNEHRLPGAAFEELVPLLDSLTFKSGRAATTQEVIAPQNAVLFFMQGKLNIGNIANAKISAALCWLPDGLASSMLIHAAIAEDIFVLHLDGKQAITKDHFQVAGNASLKLLGLDLFHGSFRASNGKLYLEASAFEIEGSPIAFHGMIDGDFGNDIVKLDGAAYFRFFFLKGNARVALYLQQQGESYFNAEAELEAGSVFSGSFKFLSSLDQAAGYRSAARFNIAVLGVFRINYDQQVTIRQKHIDLQGQAKFLFLDQEFLSAEVLYSDGLFTLKSSFNLISILKANGEISFGNDYFALKADILMTLAGLEAAGMIDAVSDKSGQRFYLEINRLFGPDNSLKFNLESTEGALQLKSNNNRPINVWGGLLKISDRENEQQGPQFAMAFEKDYLKYLTASASVTAFGLASAQAYLEYSNAQSSFSCGIEAHIDTAAVKSDARFNLLYRPDNFNLSGDFHMAIDLGEALNNILYSYMGIRIPGLHMIVKLDMNDFKFSVENTTTPSFPDIGAIDESIKRLNQKIAEINALSQAALEGMNLLLQEADETVADINKRLLQPLLQYQQTTLQYWKIRLLDHKKATENIIAIQRRNERQIAEEQDRLQVARNEVEAIGFYYDNMVHWLDNLNRRSKWIADNWYSINVDWERDQYYSMKDNVQYSIKNTFGFVNNNEVNEIMDNYYWKYCAWMPKSRSDSERWTNGKFDELKNRKNERAVMLAHNVTSIVNHINGLESHILVCINIYNNVGIPVIKSYLLQSHIEMKLIDTAKKSAEQQKHELPLDGNLTRQATNETETRVVFRVNATAEIPIIGKFSLANISISWATVSSINADKSLWEHLKQALTAYFSEHLLSFIHDRCHTIWDVANCLKEFIASGSIQGTAGENGFEPEAFVGGFARIGTDEAHVVKAIIDNPPPFQ